ncbi:ribosome silencing factor [Massilioclostridium coli]|uniref:ribosome silencing factor n=1 Tax=Massilioclostridium coli TaxID=1870991 RepID=UPI00085C7B07|nr:ribosome silencing factor [Massilioclostridium coli]
MTTLELVKKVVKTLDDKKAEDIQVIRVGDLTILGEYFIIADGTNSTHVKSLVDEVEYQTKQVGKTPTRIERDTSANWIILDYTDVVVHMFYKEAREFYDLERLWKDGEQISVSELLEETKD